MNFPLFRIFLLILVVNHCLYSQDSMSYEKKINDSTLFNFYEYKIHQKIDNINLFGTLITPKNNYDKVVFIVPGSGKDTRHSHFLLTEYLLKNEIAVFRYDERGVGKSEGKNDVFYTINDMSNDFQAIVNELITTDKFINKKIGFLGHSYGGLVTIEAIEKGLKCDFIIQWATPVEKISELFKYQIKTEINKQEKNLQYDNDEIKFRVIDSISNIIERNKTLDDKTLRNVIYIEMKKYGYKKNDFGWFITFSSYLELLKKDYITTYKKITIPTLYLIGTNDNYVNPNSNTSILKKINNPKIEIKVFDSLNHYLTNSKKLDLNTSIYEIDEYAKKYIMEWIKFIN